MKEYKLKINGNEYNIAINSIEGTTASVNVNGVDYTVEVPEGLQAAAGAGLSASGVGSAHTGAGVAVAPGTAATTAPAVAGGRVIKSPLPGVIIGLEAREGIAVKRGQRIAVLEAMKMENDILAECDGTIAAVHVGKGDSVLEGAAIVTIA